MKIKIVSRRYFEERKGNSELAELIEGRWCSLKLGMIAGSLLVAGGPVVAANVCSVCLGRGVVSCVNCSTQGAVCAQDGERKAGTTMEIGLSDGEKMTFCWCPATTSAEWKKISGGKDWFEMGSQTNEYGRGSDEIRHRVKLTKGFWMAQTPVTQGQFSSVFGATFGKKEGDSRLPVTDIEWSAACAFCMEVTRRYLADGRMFLPTEAQWEYAARSGDVGSGPVKDAVHEYACCLDGGETSGKQPVKSKKPSAWGLYDMLGNVWEWCVDCRSPYGEGLLVDPEGEQGYIHFAMRGGSFRSPGWKCRYANRGGSSWFESCEVTGFRPIIVPVEKQGLRSVARVLTSE